MLLLLLLISNVAVDGLVARTSRSVTSSMTFDPTSLSQITRTGSNLPGNAFDGNTGTYAVPVPDTNSQDFMFAFGFSSASVNSIKIMKQAGTVADVSIYYSTSTSALNSRTWYRVSGATNGYFNTEKATYTSMTSDGQILSESSSASSTYSISFDTVSCTGLAILVTRNDNSYNIYPTYEIYALYFAPTITSIDPTRGTEGTLVVVTGEGFSYGEPLLCKFGSTTSYATASSDTELFCHSPPNSNAAYTVSVYNRQWVSGPTYTYEATPTMTSTSKSTGSRTGGTYLSLGGSGFPSGGTFVVYFAGVPTPATYSSSSVLLCYTPAMHTSAGSSAVTFSWNSGINTASATFSFTFVTVSVTSLSEVNGPAAGGTAVTVTGTGFQSGHRCKFGTSVATFTFTSSTSIICGAPSDTAGSKRAVTVGYTDSNDFTLEIGRASCRERV